MNNMELSDRERILTEIVESFAATMLMCGLYDESSFRGMPHVARYREPKPGELVMGTTGPAGRWKIGWYVEKQSDGALIREIGTGALCNYGNESFSAIVGLRDDQLLEGDQRVMKGKILSAFARGDEYLYRFGGAKFDSNKVTITIREAHGGLGGDSMPFSFVMQYDKRTTVKQILAAMVAAGYGTKSFKPESIAA